MKLDKLDKKEIVMEKQPIVIIHWAEGLSKGEQGKRMLLGEADKFFKKLGGAKITFTIEYVSRGTLFHYAEYMKDGNGSLIDRLKDVGELNLELEEFIPYLEMHKNLYDIEQKTKRIFEHIKNIENPTERVIIKLDYCKRLQSHVMESRREINTAIGTPKLKALPLMSDGTLSNIIEVNKTKSIIDKIKEVKKIMSKPLSILEKNKKNKERAL